MNNLPKKKEKEKEKCFLANDTILLNKPKSRQKLPKMLNYESIKKEEKRCNAQHVSKIDISAGTLMYVVSMGWGFSFTWSG